MAGKGFFRRESCTKEGFNECGTVKCDVPYSIQYPNTAVFRLSSSSCCISFAVSGPYVVLRNTGLQGSSPANRGNPTSLCGRGPPRAARYDGPNCRLKLSPLDACSSWVVGTPRPPLLAPPPLPRPARPTPTHAYANLFSSEAPTLASHSKAPTVDRNTVILLPWPPRGTRVQYAHTTTRPSAAIQVYYIRMSSIWACAVGVSR